MEIRSFQRGDREKIETKGPVGAANGGYYYDGMEALSWTMVEDGQPIAAWGMQPHWDGVATVWSVFSDRALTRYRTTVAKNVKRRLEEQIEKLGLHRVQSMIFAGDAVSIRFIEWLGFHCEGCFERYIKNMDMMMFARLVD